VQVVFARGTGEPPGIGATGQAFVDGLRARIGGVSVDVYPVDYPASNEWDTGLDGINDAGVHVVSMAHECPNTQLVLSGHSQGAAVMGFVTSASVPDGFDPATVPKPMTSEVANHVSSVLLFGMPNRRAMNFLNEPPVTIGPLYQPKTLKVCAPEESVCSDGMNFAAHGAYASDEAIIDEGATFTADHIGITPHRSRSVVRPPDGVASGNFLASYLSITFDDVIAHRIDVSPLANRADEKLYHTAQLIDSDLQLSPTQLTRTARPSAPAQLYVVRTGLRIANVYRPDRQMRAVSMSCSKFRFHYVIERWSVSAAPTSERRPWVPVSCHIGARHPPDAATAYQQQS
jgi:hypothetical protein